MSNCEGFKQQADALTPRIFSLRGELNEAEAKEKEARDRLTKAKQDLDRANQNLEVEIDVINNFEKEVINGPAQIAAARKSVADAKARCEKSRREYKKLKAKYRYSNDPGDKMKVDTARLQMNMAINEYQQAEAALKSAEDRFNNAKNYLKNEAAEELLKKVKERNAALRAYEKAEKDCQEAQQKIKELSEQIEAKEKQFADLMEAYRKCMEQKRAYR